jgi:recombination protein RecA
MSSVATAVEQLKDLLGDKLRSPEQVKAPEGVATGFGELDRFLLWHGLPKGALSLFSGAIGTGATSLFVEAAARTTDAGKWVAWINNDIPLSPLPLSQKGVNLARFVSIQPDAGVDGSVGSAPADARSLEKARSAHLFFILQELMSSALFELVGCDLGNLQLKEHQLRKLQAQARDANVALVFISQNANVARLGQARRRALFYRGSAATAFSLILQFEKRHLTIERALHRQTPHRVARSLSYARFTSFANAACARLMLGR